MRDPVLYYKAVRKSHRLINYYSVGIKLIYILSSEMYFGENSLIALHKGTNVWAFLPIPGKWYDYDNKGYNSHSCPKFFGNYYIQIETQRIALIDVTK